MSFAQTEIIASAFDATVWEMCASLIRTAYSPNIKERADCSTALCDMRGRTLALATHGPAHLGSTLLLVPAILQRFPLETLREGDVFIANDPYIVGVTHLNDCTVATPVFVDGQPVAFAAAVAHHSDVGGRVPGSESGDSLNLFQEGIRYPPMKLHDAGTLRGDVWELFLLNSRTPHFSEGDLYAQIAANRRGLARMHELFARYGARRMSDAIDQMLDATERRMRAAIADALRPGTYHASDWLDEDGVSDTPVKLSATLHISGDRVTFDFSDCGPQIGSGKNMPYTQVMATVYYCMKVMLDPDLPINEGLYRCVSVIAPHGSIANPRPPGGVSSRNLTSMILADAILDCMGQAAPDRALAAGGPYHGIILAGQDAARGRYFVDYENFAGGHGARCDADGADVMQLYMTNTSNLPIEVMETEFPVRVERYELRSDSGGAGRWRGGTGVYRELRILADDVSLATRSARIRFAASGRDGGLDGMTGSYCLNPDTDGDGTSVHGTTSGVVLGSGDLLRVSTPGGGGFGDPRTRDPQRVRADVAEGKVSPAAARRDYAVVLSPDTNTVDAQATARLRGTRS